MCDAAATLLAACGVRSAHGKSVEFQRRAPDSLHHRRPMREHSFPRARHDSKTQRPMRPATRDAMRARAYVNLPMAALNTRRSRFLHRMAMEPVAIAALVQRLEALDYAVPPTGLDPDTAPLVERVRCVQNTSPASRCGAPILPHCGRMSPVRCVC